MSSKIPISTVKKWLQEAILNGTRNHVLQFSNLLTMLQYRTPYEVTLRVVQKDMRALDWGCGNGHFSYFLTRQHIATTGFTFDNFPVFLESEPLFCFVKGLISEPMKLPIPDSSFDVVFSVGVLEHVHETGGSEMESLREIRRILKHGGRFVCFHFPNKYQWVETLGKPLGLLEHFHQRKYTRKYIERLTEQSGFRIVEIGRYNFFPRNQLRFLPDMLTKQDIVVYLFESLEWLASHLLSCFCTNYYFVAENKQ